MIYVCDSYFYIDRDTFGFLPTSVLEIGLSCRSPLAAVQFIIEPIAPGIQPLPVFNTSYCDGEDWLIEGQVNPDGSIKIIALDTLLRGKPLNPYGEFYSFCQVEYQVDSLVPAGIYPVKISEILASDTAGNLIPLGVSGGKVTVSRKEALLYSPPDTIFNKIGQYTWRLYETNFYPVGGIYFNIKVPFPGFKLEKIVTDLLPVWKINYLQDSLGIIRFEAYQSSPLITRPCLREKEILPISLTFSVDSSLTPGIYQFDLVNKLVVWDCTDNFLLTTEDVLSALVVTAQTSIGKNGRTIPKYWSLGPNFPNPFNAETYIQFATPEAAHVKLEIVNLKGERVAKLMDATVNAGNYQILWRAVHLPAGIYFIYLRAGDFRAVRKLTLLK